MDDEGRGARQRKKQADPTCCPVCGITVRGQEIEQHYSLEMERLNKLSTQKNRKSHSKDMASPVATAVAAATSTSPTGASSSSENKDCWNTYQRIKNNRSSRLKVGLVFFNGLNKPIECFESLHFRLNHESAK